MPSRQDQLHSYQYSLQRVVAALVTHDPDPHRSPLRRAGTTALVSVLVAALALTGAAVWGILTGASTEPKDESVVYLEKGSGAQYVYLKSDGKLHPVLNYTSGLLIANASQPSTVNASRKSLAKAQLGDPLGIPDAPDSLPRTGELLPGIWTICSQQPQGPSASGAPRSLLLVGDDITDGAVLPVPDPRTLASQLRALLVIDPSDRTFLVYANHRFLIPANRVQQTRTRFGWTDQPLPVATAWINAVPAGPDWRPPAIPELGRRSSELPDHEIGQILRIPGTTTNGPTQWGVVMADGVADITDVQALLMQTDPVGYRPQTMDPNQYGNLRRSTTSMVAAAAAAGFPPAPPVLLNRPQRGVCLTYTAGQDSIGIRLDPTMPEGAAVPSSTVPGGVLADVVYVRRGRGALVVAAASPSAPAGSGTVSIVTDTGRRYPLATRDLLGKLGYGGVTPRPLPAQLIALLPQGPSLDATKARESSPGDGG